MSDLKSLAQHAVESAKKYGAQNAAADLYRSQSTNILWRKGQIEDIKSSGPSALTINLFVDGRFGSFDTSDLRPDSVDGFIRGAVQMTKLLEEDPARTLPDPSLYENRADIDLELYDPTVAKLTPNDLIDMCGKLEAECQKMNDLSIFDITTSCDMKLYQSYKVNTNGFEGVTRKSNTACGCSITVIDGEKKVSGYTGNSARFWGDLHKPDQQASKAAENCRYRLGAKKLPSKKRTIVLDPNHSVFMYYFLSPLSGYSFIEKESYFIDKIGKMVGSPLVDIHDMPFIKRGVSSRLFDDEGISSKESTIIDHGKLEFLHLDTYCANKLKMKATGESSNVVLTPGKRSCKEIIADVKDGIYVIDLIGGNSDPTQGDFSYGIVGVAIENGKLTQNVCEMNISGNMLELWKNLTEVGNDPRNDTNYLMPTLRFDNVSTSGS